MTAEEHGKKIDELNWIFAGFRETLEKMREGKRETEWDAVAEPEEAWE
jgi:hypothetical protein